MRFGYFAIAVTFALLTTATTATPTTAAATVTVYPTVDQCAEDVEFPFFGWHQDGVFDSFAPPHDISLQIINFGDPLEDRRGVMEFPVAPMPANASITKVALQFYFDLPINHDDPQIFVHGYSANGVIEPNDFLPAGPLFGIVSGYENFPDGGFPPGGNFRELDITAPYLENNFGRLGFVVYRKQYFRVCTGYQERGVWGEFPAQD